MREYQEVAQLYSTAVGALAVRFLDEEEYEELSAAAEAARTLSREARARLDAHIAQHQCLIPTAA